MNEASGQTSTTTVAATKPTSLTTTGTTNPKPVRVEVVNSQRWWDSSLAGVLLGGLLAALIGGVTAYYTVRSERDIGAEDRTHSDASGAADRRQSRFDQDLASAKVRRDRTAETLAWMQALSDQLGAGSVEPANLVHVKLSEDAVDTDADKQRLEALRRELSRASLAGSTLSADESQAHRLKGLLDELIPAIDLVLVARRADVEGMETDGASRVASEVATIRTQSTGSGSGS